MKKILLIWLGIIGLIILIYGTIIGTSKLILYLNSIHKEYCFWIPLGILVTFAFAIFIYDYIK